MMIARANNWITNQVPYDETGWYASPSGDGTYREDCAGFVAMAWHMTWSPPVTTPPPGLDDPSISQYLGTVSSLNSAGQLGAIQPGDALAITAEHIVLFAGWTDSTHTWAAIDSESHSGAPTSQAIWGTDYLMSQGYKVYRYNNNQTYNPGGPPTVTIAAAPALAYDTGASTMRIYRWGTTGSSFTSPSVYASGTYRLSAVNRLTATGDVDGDGRSDIVQAYQNDDGTFSFHVFLDGNSSAGVWYTSGSFSLAAVGGRLVVADFNGDGKAEPALVYDNGGTQTIYRWLSTGTSFTRTTDYVGTGSFHLGNVADRVAAGDVNGDGKADIVEAYQLGDGTFAFYVFLGGINSVGVWYTSGTFNLGPVANRLVVADFNGDGKAEPALVYDNGGTQTIYRWLSTGSSFARTTDYVGAGSFNLANVQDRVAAADVNGDGNADVVEAYQLGDGTFAYYVFLSGLNSVGVWYTSGSFNLANVDDRLVLGTW